MLKEMSILVPTEESLNSEMKAERQRKTDIRSQQSITAMTNAEGVLTEIGVINLRTVTERSR